MLLSKFASAFLSRSTKVPKLLPRQLLYQSLRNGGGDAGKRVVRVRASRVQSRRLWRYLAIYTLVGAVPAVFIIFVTTVFVGDAQLYDYDPDLHDPEQYEFYSHPITRFLAKYCMEDPKLSYYKHIYSLELESHQLRAARLIDDVEFLEKKMGHASWDNFKTRIHNKDVVEEMDKYAKEHGITETRRE